jgi:hypothetical protein
MIDWRTMADELLDEYNACCRARPHDNTIDIQLEKDNCAKWASHLAMQRTWGTELEIAEACHQLVPRLERLKSMVITDILSNVTI